MKITDYVILFMTIMFSFVIVCFLKDSILFQTIIYNEEVNRIVDNTTIEALRKGYKGINCTEEKVDGELVIESFLKYMSLSLYGTDNNNSRDKVKNSIVCMIVVLEDGYYIYEKGMLSEKRLFNENLHEKKVVRIEKEIEDMISDYDYKILFPKNNGEHNSQTISPNSLLVIYRTNIKDLLGETYAECILSEASIKKISNNAY